MQQLPKKYVMNCFSEKSRKDYYQYIFNHRLPRSWFLAVYFSYYSRVLCWSASECADSILYSVVVTPQTPDTCQIYSSPKSAERCNFRKHSPIFSSLTHDAAKGINRHKDRKCHSIMGAFSYHFPFVVQNWWNHMSFLKLWCTELQGHCT